MTTPEAPPIPREALLVLTVDELVDIALLALEGQRLATQNALTFATQLAEVQALLKAAQDKLLSNEAELLTLRNRP